MLKKLGRLSKKRMWGSESPSREEIEQQLILTLDDECYGSQNSMMQHQPPQGVDVDENKVYFYCPVSEKEVFELNKILNRLDIEMQYLSLRFGIKNIPIELHIHSPGGDVFAGIAASEFIRKSTTPIHTYVDGSVASAASLMSISGDKRFMFENAFMMIHQISTLAQGKYEEFKDEIINQELIMDKIKQIYLKRTSMTEEKIDDMLKHDLWLDSKTCKEYGLVDKII